MPEIVSTTDDFEHGEYCTETVVGSTREEFLESLLEPSVGEEIYPVRLLHFGGRTLTKCTEGFFRIIPGHYAQFWTFFDEDLSVKDVDFLTLLHHRMDLVEEGIIKSEDCWETMEWDVAPEADMNQSVASISIRGQIITLKVSEERPPVISWKIIGPNRICFS